MKKYLFLIPLLILILAGCSSNKEGTILCTTSSKDVVNGYSVSSEYKINYKGDLVESVDSIETITSSSSAVLEMFQETLESTYASMNAAYGGYTVNVSVNGNTITSKVTIDYNKMNIEQFAKDTPSLKGYISDNKFTVEGIQKLYESLGATCKK